MFEKHSAIMLIIDPDSGNIINANQAAADFYGWPVDELRTMHIQTITTSTPEAVMDEMNKARLSRKNHFLFQHHKADGSIHDVEVFSTTIDIEGKDRLYSIIHDITQRKQVEQALQISERKFRSITEQMTEMVFVTNSIGSLTYLSPAAENLFGYLPQEMTGHSFTEYMIEEEISPALALFHETLLQQLNTRKVEVTFHRKNDTSFIGEVHLHR